MRYLGIDYGDKKIGLALGDDEVKVAVPLDVVRHEGERTAILLAELVKRERVDAVVVGVPLSAGEAPPSEQEKKTLAFIDALRLLISVPVYEEDERYTSSESSRIKREHGSNVSEDALAATMILQAFFDR
ncbi:MAG: Holliday junction resolvase RuvX [Patescibacteria group bacterium]